MLKKLAAICSALALCVCLLSFNVAYAYDGEEASEKQEIKPYYFYDFSECIE